MIYCRDCDQLRNNDPDGMVLTCALTGQRCFINDLPLTTMSRCPKMDKSQRKYYPFKIDYPVDEFRKRLKKSLEKEDDHEQN